MRPPGPPLDSTIAAPKTPDFRAVVIGASAGGLNALRTLLQLLPKNFPLPILIAQHRLAESHDYVTISLNQTSSVQVKEAEEKEMLRAGWVYIAPANYHLLVERDETLSLSAAAKENFSRPSIDVLFESAAYVWSSRLIGVILTGANEDGARGMALIKQRGGTTLVQNPDTAAHDIMPQAALTAASADHVLDIGDIGTVLKRLAGAK